MKRIFSVLLVALMLLALISVVGCSGKEEKVIVVGATPSPHAEILNSKAVQDYVTSKGYKLEVRVYQDYVTPNKALNDGGLDANYFQHMPYLSMEIEEKGYDLAVACYVHNEPLNLYGKQPLPELDSAQTIEINIINDASNVERAYKLLQANGIISSYSVEDFDAQHPVYETEHNVAIFCIDPGLLHNKVDDGGYAVIPGNYALTAWSAEKATEYRLFGEATDVAYPNLVAVRTADKDSEKIKILVEALNQEAVKQFIEETYGPTVNYCFSK